MKRAKIQYEIRWARQEEWQAAMELVWRTFLQFEGNEYTAEGIRNFYDFIKDPALRESFEAGEYQMLVALDGTKIIGVASARCRNHLSLLFVDEAYHRRGVGAALMKRLCQYMRDEAGEKYISLKAAPYAVNFYRKLGFRTVTPEEEYSGIRVTSMEKIFREG